MTTVKRNAQWNLFCRAVVLSHNRNAVSMKAQCTPVAAIILLQWLRTADAPVISVSVRYCSAVGKHVFLSTVSIRGSLMYFTSCAFLQDKTTSTCFDIDRPLVIKLDLFPHQTHIGWRHLLQCCSHSIHRSDTSLHFISSDRINDQRWME